MPSTTDAPAPLLYRMRSFNKRVLNRLTGRIAHSSHGFFAIVKHVGRRSGKAYETPIIVAPVANGFVIALTYGTQVDWYRNVTAAGRCELIYHQRDYAVDQIEPLPLEQARPLFPAPLQLILRAQHVNQFIRLSSRPSPK
ncbi:MAG TPA: nitroreductase family deazaflavin-dependent oxidoreductase [Phototrophicaceae bacterium]|nr:nitroreductase family deazaflavin-dependent oxidoreductase [Phototrophicaceae bacterium]